jgi:hypothetical protein
MQEESLSVKRLRLSLINMTEEVLLWAFEFAGGRSH